MIIISSIETKEFLSLEEFPGFTKSGDCVQGLLVSASDVLDKSVWCFEASGDGQGGLRRPQTMDTKPPI